MRATTCCAATSTAPTTTRWTSCEQERLSTVTCRRARAPSAGTLGHFALHAMGVRVVSLRRANGKAARADDDALLEGGDTLVLSGRSETLALAEEKLLAG